MAARWGSPHLLPGSERVCRALTVYAYGQVCYGHRDGLNNTCSLKAVSSTCPPLWAQGWNLHFKVKGEGRSLPLSRPCSWDITVPLITSSSILILVSCSLASENLSARVGMGLSRSSEISEGNQVFFRRRQQE